MFTKFRDKSYAAIEATANAWQGTPDSPAGNKWSFATVPETITATALTTYWTGFVPLAGDDGDNPVAKFFFILAWLAAYTALFGSLFFKVDQNRNIRREHKITRKPEEEVWEEAPSCLTKIQQAWSGTAESPAGYKWSLSTTVPAAVLLTALTNYWVPFLPLAGDHGDNPAAKTFFILAWLGVYLTACGAHFYDVDL